MGSSINLCEIISVEPGSLSSLRATFCDYDKTPFILGFSDDTVAFFFPPKISEEDSSFSESPRRDSQSSSPRYQQFSSDADEACCFSILVKNGSNLHLEARSSTTRKKWVQTLRTLVAAENAVNELNYDHSSPHESSIRGLMPDEM
jgi:hypothetical protein